MKILKFEDIPAWQKPQELAVQIYSAFNENKDWDFRNQLCRAAVSISNNIAEGFNRTSDSQFNLFLSYSQGSCAEVRSMLYLAMKLNYLDAEKAKVLLNSSNEILKIIFGLMKALKS